MKSYEWDHIDKEVAMMREAGITMLRTDLQFSRVARTKGSYDFSACDALLAKLDGTGISLLPILSGYDWEIQSCRPDAVPLYKHPGEWRNFVRAAAEHYKGRIRVWEIWNEPDGGFWKPQPNAEQYAQLLKIAHEELKKADPANQVMVGGLCGWERAISRIFTPPEPENTSTSSPCILTARGRTPVPSRPAAWRNSGR